MPLINVRGIDFFYREAGQGAPLLLIHGAAGHADVWPSVFESLARDHRVIAYDRRAHTRSKAAPPPPGQYYATHADDAAALLQALGAAPAIVVGWSGGAMNALHLTARHPALVSSLVLEEPPFQLFSGPVPDVVSIFLREQLDGEAQLRDAAEGFLRFAMSYRTGGTAFDTFEPALRESLIANAGTLLPNLRADANEELTLDQLRRITCPVTCVVGDLTPEAIVACTDRLVEIVAHARVIRIADAAHAIHIDQPERFVDAVRSTVIAGA
jgi:pimeloyl-ACP methyl ester carboxylesterase